MRVVMVAVTALLWAVPSGAEAPTGADAGLDLPQVRELRAQAEEDPTVDDGLRPLVLERYDAAIASLENAADARDRAVAAERERAGLDRLAGALREELAQPRPEPRLDLPEEPSVEQAETALARERASLAAHRADLRSAATLADERAAARANIAKRLGELDQALERLGDELRVVSLQDVHPELRRAMRTAVLARQAEALAESEALRASLSPLQAQAAMTGLEVDLAKLRVAESEQRLNMLEELTARLHTEAAVRHLEEIQTACRAAAASSGVLAPMAAEIEEMAEALWGAEGIVAATEQSSRDLAAIREDLSELERIAGLARRKYEALAGHGSLQRWWPEVPQGFPKPGDVQRLLLRLELRIPQVEHRLITLEQERAQSQEVRERLWRELDAHVDTDGRAEVESNARELLALRRELLDRLVQQYGTTSDLLVEYRSVARHFRARLEEVERFLYSRVLWVRSVPRPIVPRLADLVEGVGWLLSGGASARPETLRRVDSGAPIGRGQIVSLLVVAVLVLVRRRLRARLVRLGERAIAADVPELKLTSAAYLQTLLLAAPLPLFLYTCSNLVHGSLYRFTAAEAFVFLAAIAALLELGRQVLSPCGVAVAHFSWPAAVAASLHRGLLWGEVVALPSLYVALQLSFAGVRLDSPERLQVYSNSLGRVAFVVGMTVLGGALLGALRPHRGVDQGAAREQTLWTRRFARYAFPVAVIYAYPVVLATTLIPAVLAAAGFYITGLLLAYQMLRTTWLLVAVLLVGGLGFRWQAARSEAMHRAEGEASPAAADDPARGVAERQVRQLLRFASAAAVAIGLVVIWSDALPMLQVLKRVQIWPTVAVLEQIPVDGQTTDGGTAPGDTRADGVGGSGDDTGVPAVPGTGAPSTVARQPSVSAGLTLWNLILALLAGLVTAVLARNLPGLIELFLATRTTLDTGGRVALATLTRYTIAIVGMATVFGFLQVSWSKVQWLAAALTFGLGFGLQEVVANFVSGLILLVERPVRVGDVVTIGNLMGRVTRIQIRATTITLWDRSEMIVPNKEFITKHLVNWTLSDSKRRIDIPVRVAYGTDLDRVKTILLQAADEHPDVLAEPSPQALLIGFGNDAVNLELRYVVEFGRGMVCKDEVQMQIDKAFKAAGVEFALPRLDVRGPDRGRAAQTTEGAADEEGGA